MSENDENIETEVKTKTKKREKKPKKERKREGKFWQSTKEFFKGLWKFISFFLKIILAPFWYTGVLFVKSVQFLRERGDYALTDKDKKFLSLIPALFFMMCVSIIAIFLILYFELLDETIKVITDIGFWAAVGDFFTRIGMGIYWLLQIIFVTFFWEMIIKRFGDFMQAENYYWATLIIIVIVIVGTGLGILMYHAMKTRTIIKAIGRFFKKIWSYPKRAFNYIREQIILKYLVGQKFIDTRSKNFFWVTVLIQFILTILIGIFSLVLGIYNYVVGTWDPEAILRYSLLLAGLLFIFIGVFSTWFFIRVFGVTTEESEKYTI
jgi:hypothetical protein